MRIIPKKVKVKNTVWKCYSLVDVIVALFVFALTFLAVTAGNWVLAIILGLMAVVMFMPTADGIFYTVIFENIKFLFAKKNFTPIKGIILLLIIGIVGALPMINLWG